MRLMRPRENLMPRSKKNVTLWGGINEAHPTTATGDRCPMPTGFKGAQG